MLVLGFAKCCDLISLIYKTLNYVNSTDPPYLTCTISDRSTQLRHPPKPSQCSNGVCFCHRIQDMLKSKKFIAENFYVYKSIIWDKFIVWSTIPAQCTTQSLQLIQRLPSRRGFFKSVLLLPLLTLCRWVREGSAGKSVHWRARLNSGNMTWCRC